MNQLKNIILRGNIEKVFYAGSKFSAGGLTTRGTKSTGGKERNIGQDLQD